MRSLVLMQLLLFAGFICMHNHVCEYYLASKMSLTYNDQICDVGNHCDENSIEIDINLLPPIIQSLVGRPEKTKDTFN